MEPQLSNPNFSPEQPHNNPKNPEVTPVSPVAPEVAPAQPIEQLKSVETKGKGEGSPRTSASATTLPTVAPPPVSDDAVIADDNNTTQTPSAAADDDVIEKEWVNKAKKVVSDTKGDPYRQEREVSKLQADYMQKRYGKHVKIPEDV